ncbi:protein-L-isoaspartate O-methyltransferase [uncultured Sphingomonas sp.]|uniref:protein-L-isoaspartate O-methyltransferase family protein n=1 Tax=uncultured Sphingomonas sp. TaxID=158754 RepID=UPI0035CAFA74
MNGSIESAGVGTAAYFFTMRQAMVTSQLRTTAVDDARLVAAMATVERERFVPSASRDLAYRDTAIPLGRGRALNLPMATGRLLNEAYLRPEDHVLLIGAATGYSAAILALLVRNVIAVEADATLAQMARTALATTADVQVVEGALAAGHPAAAPYDVIVIDGAVEEVPTSLLDQLGVGGRIVTGLADRGVTRLASGRRGERGFGLAAFADADCVMLPGFNRPRAFTF